MLSLPSAQMVPEHLQESVPRRHGGPQRPYSNVFACLLLFYRVSLRQGPGRKQEHSVEITEESLIKGILQLDWAGLRETNEDRHSQRVAAVTALG